MKLNNVPGMSRRGRPKLEIHQPKAGKNSNDQIQMVQTSRKQRRDTGLRAKNCEAILLKCAGKDKKNRDRSLRALEPQRTAGILEGWKNGKRRRRRQNSGDRRTAKAEDR